MSCKWKKVKMPFGDFYETECKHEHLFSSGSIDDFNFCPFCSEQIEESCIKDGDDEFEKERCLQVIDLESKRDGFYQ